MNNEIEYLIAIEEIKSLKAKYFRCIDTKDWQGLSECFTDDLDADFQEAPGPHTQSKAEYIAMIQDALKDAKTVHHGHMPEIKIDSANSASGIWAMEDIVRLPGLTLQGWGYYHEEYLKVDSCWLISKIKLTRLILDVTET